MSIEGGPSASPEVSTPAPETANSTPQTPDGQGVDGAAENKTDSGRKGFEAAAEAPEARQETITEETPEQIEAERIAMEQKADHDNERMKEVRAIILRQEVHIHRPGVLPKRAMELPIESQENKDRKYRSAPKKPGILSKLAGGIRSIGRAFGI